MDNKLEELYNKIDDIVFDTSDDCRLPVSKYYKGQILSLMEEYATSKAKEFAIFIAENVQSSYYINGDGRWELSENIGTINTEELYKTFTNTLNSK